MAAKNGRKCGDPHKGEPPRRTLPEGTVSRHLAHSRLLQGEGFHAIFEIQCDGLVCGRSNPTLDLLAVAQQDFVFVEFTSVLVLGFTACTVDQSGMCLAVQPGTLAKSNRGTSPAAVVFLSPPPFFLVRCLMASTSSGLG